VVVLVWVLEILARALAEILVQASVPVLSARMSSIELRQ
jgi:hypothetical protein